MFKEEVHCPHFMLLSLQPLLKYMSYLSNPFIITTDVHKHNTSNQNKIKLKIVSLFLNNVSSFPASGHFCRLLIIFANSLEQDQAIGPDLDPKLFDTLVVVLKEFFEKVNLKKNQQTTKKICAKFPTLQIVIQYRADFSFTYLQIPLINAHTNVSSWATNLGFGWSLHLYPYVVYVSSEGTGESGHMHTRYGMLAIAFVA